MTDKILNQNWDSFEDKVTYSDDGIAQLGRWYKKNGYEIFHHIKETGDDKDVIPIPIVAYGITAFLSDNNVTSFRCSLNSKLGINYGVGVEMFFGKHFNDRFSLISQRNRESIPFEDERKTDMELIKEHLDEERQLLLKSDPFFFEVAENEIQIVETIKKASLKYQEWLKKKILDLDKIKDIQEVAISESIDEKLNVLTSSNNDEELLDNNLNITSDQKTNVEPEKQIEKTVQGNKLDFDNLLSHIRFDRDEKTKEKVKEYLSQLRESAYFNKTNNKEFTAVALIFFQTGWVTNTKTFNDWSSIFAKAFARKKSSYKPNQIKKHTGTMKIKIPFLDDLPIK